MVEWKNASKTSQRNNDDDPNANKFMHVAKLVSFLPLQRKKELYNKMIIAKPHSLSFLEFITTTREKTNNKT